MKEVLPGPQLTALREFSGYSREWGGFRKPCPLPVSRRWRLEFRETKASGIHRTEN